MEASVADERKAEAQVLQMKDIMEKANGHPRTAWKEKHTRKFTRLLQLHSVVELRAGGIKRRCTVVREQRFQI